MQLLCKIQIQIQTLNFTTWPSGVAKNGCKNHRKCGLMQKVAQNLHVCKPFSMCIIFGFFRHELWLNSCSLHWMLPTQSERLRWVWTESHWIRPSSPQNTSCAGLSAASRIMRWCWQIFHTHCRAIRSDAIRFAALKRCIWRSLQTEGSVCLMQRAWRTCFRSTKAADDNFSSSPFRVFS